MQAHYPTSLLAKLGNSGNSVGPHLHFHVGSGPGLNSYDAVPHVYRSYWLSGHGKPDPAKRRRIEFKVPTDNCDGDVLVHMSMRST